MQIGKLWSHKDHKNTLFRHSYAPQFAVCHGKNGKKWPFLGQKMFSFGLGQAVENCPPILRVLDAKKQVVVTHR